MSNSIMSDRTKLEMGSDERPIMPADLFIAAVQGNNDFLVRHLGLPAEVQSHIQVTVEACEPQTNQLQEEKEVVQYNLECATSFGETILHILVANRHNDLVKEVFQKNASLLKAQDKQLQTPLHYAAKAGSAEIIHDLIQLDPDEVKNALKETDYHRDTTLHLAVKHGHVNVIEELLKLNHEMVNMANKEEQSPFHIAIVEGRTLVAQYMLEVDSSLAYTRFSNGMFPIHVAARIGNAKLVKLLLEKYSDSAKLQDQHGRIFFHVAAEENKIEVFKEGYNCDNVILKRMMNTKDYDGNTPLHIAAMKGHKRIMIELWARSVSDSSSTKPNKQGLTSFGGSTEPNNQGLTSFDLSVIQLSNTIYKDREDMIQLYIQDSGRKFTLKWFHKIMDTRQEKRYWERSQVIGLGSVLITTVAFAAAFTVPGGYNADYGTPILGRRFMYRAFTFANALAFVQAFVSVFILVGFAATDDLDDNTIGFSSHTFVSAANCMVLSFGTGSYVMLAPVSLPNAIIILVLALLVASPVVFIISDVAPAVYKAMPLWIGWYALPFVFTFCLAFLK